MPRTFQLSGAKKRKLSREKFEKQKSSQDGKTPLNKYLVVKSGVSTCDTSGEDVTVASTSGAGLEPDNETSGTEPSHAISDESQSDCIVAIDYDASTTQTQLASKLLDKQTTPEEPIQICANVTTDPADWFPLSSDTTAYWLRQGPDDCRNQQPSNDYSKSVRCYGPTVTNPKGRKRKFNNRLFYGKLPNGETRSRKWLLYSPASGAVYCFYCTLMGSSDDKFCQKSGFSAWHMADRCIMAH